MQRQLRSGKHAYLDSHLPSPIKLLPGSQQFHIPQVFSFKGSDRPDQSYKYQHWSSNTGSGQTELFISVCHIPQHPRFLVLLYNFNSIFNIIFKGNIQNTRTLLGSTLLFELFQLLCLWPLTFSTSQFLRQHGCFLAHRKSSIASVFPSCSIKYILLQKIKAVINC